MVKPNPKEEVMNKRLTKWAQRWRYNITTPRPSRDQLNGMSPSEFKACLKQLGFRVTRDFFHCGSIAQYRNRSYRFRWWGDVYTNSTEFFVDISCPLPEFDRWANSTDQTVTFRAWYSSLKK